ncbi:MAG TPA: peptidoglycan-binding domain-containing protein [Kofleriaceae bacterium]
MGKRPFGSFERFEASAFRSFGPVSERERRNADLFFADLMGWPAPARRTRRRRIDGGREAEAVGTLNAARFSGNADLRRVINRTRLLQLATPRMTGDDIRIVQHALIDLGYTLPVRGVDGIYGPETAAAVRKFQTEQRRLDPAFLIDGIVGDQTLGRMDDILAILDRPVGARAAAPVDPTAAVIAQPGRLPYDAGTATVLGVTLHVRGTIFYPAQTAGTGTPFSAAVTGKAPIVFLAHGNHATFHNPADRTDEACPGDPGWLSTWPRINNHDGYVYLQEALAQLGFISVSVDCNDTNCSGLSATNIRRRSGLIVESVRHLISLAAAGSGSVLSGRVEFGQTGLLGHSRGAEAVLVVPSDIAAQGLSSVHVGGIISLAPTDTGTASPLPTGLPYMVILPAADGDVRANSGAHFYDRIAPAPFKTQLYVYRTNHNRFNREWVNDDFPSPLISRAAHERLLTVYAAAFFRHALGGVNFLDILLGRTQVAGVSNDDIRISAERSGVVTIDDHEDVPTPPATRTTTNTLGGATTLSGATAVEIPFSQPGVPPDNTFFGDTRGMVASSAASYGTFRSALPAPTNITGREVWIRACEVFNAPAIPPGATQFQIGVEDAAGEVAFVPSGLVARPFDRTAVDLVTKSMPETFRFAHTSFALARPGVDLTRIRAVVIRLSGIPARKMAFDQLQLV